MPYTAARAPPLGPPEGRGTAALPPLKFMDSGNARESECDFADICPNWQGQWAESQRAVGRQPCNAQTSLAAAPCVALPVVPTSTKRYVVFYISQRFHKRLSVCAACITVIRVGAIVSVT